MVTPEKIYGYADKNWGRDFTSPWVWLSSNCLISQKTGKQLPSRYVAYPSSHLLFVSAVAVRPTGGQRVLTHEDAAPARFTHGVIQRAHGGRELV